MGTAIKHPVPDRVKPSFVIFDIRALWRSGQSVRVPGCQKLQIKGLKIRYLLTDQNISHLYMQFIRDQVMIYNVKL